MTSIKIIISYLAHVTQFMKINRKPFRNKCKKLGTCGNLSQHDLSGRKAFLGKQSVSCETSNESLNSQ